MGYHVMYDRSAWFLRVIMSSSRALCWSPSVKKQKQTSIFFVQQLLDSDSASASADNPYLDLDYSGYHKNLIH